LHSKNKSTIALVFIVALAASLFSSAAFFLLSAQGQPTSSLPSSSSSSSSLLNSTYISQSLGTPLVIANNQTGVISAILIRQSPTVTEPGGIIDNNFTLMNTVVEFTVPSNQTTDNQTVFATGFFSLLENETNLVVQKVVSYNWTVLDLAPYSVQDTPKLQFLHWATMGNLTTIVSDIKSIAGNTTITGNSTTTTSGTMPTTAPQTTLNGTYIANALNGTLVNGTALVDVMLPRMDVNITSALFPGINLSEFASMGSMIEFMSMPNATTATGTSTTTGNNTTVMVMGEFALKESEINAVEKVFGNLTAYPLITNVTITAIHDHFLEETPKMVFMHFEITGDQNQTIQLLNQAINQTSMFGNMTTTTTTTPNISTPSATPTTTPNTGTSSGTGTGTENGTTGTGAGQSPTPNCTGSTSTALPGTSSTTTLSMSSSLPEFPAAILTLAVVLLASAVAAVFAYKRRSPAPTSLKD